MPNPRTPNQGVLIAPVPAMFPSRMFGGNAGTPGPGANTTVALGVFNAGSGGAGANCVVWHLEISMNPLAGASRAWYFGLQTMLGTKGWTPTPAVPLVPGTPAGQGQIVNAYDTNWPTDGTYFQINLQDGYWKWEHDYPLAVVPPGYSWFCYGLPAARALLSIDISALFENAPTAVR
jgi:hypothetical protein